MYIFVRSRQNVLPLPSCFSHLAHNHDIHPSLTRRSSCAAGLSLLDAESSSTPHKRRGERTAILPMLLGSGTHGLMFLAQLRIKALVWSIRRAYHSISHHIYKGSRASFQESWVYMNGAEGFHGLGSAWGWMRSRNSIVHRPLQQVHNKFAKI